MITGISEQVAALARKISSSSSRDLPPSYSKVCWLYTSISKVILSSANFQVDLTQIGLTINDHFNPPPHYDVCNDEFYLEDARGRRISRFSLVSQFSI